MNSSNRTYRFYLELPKLGTIKKIITLPKLKKPITTFEGDHYWDIGADPNYFNNNNVYDSSITNDWRIGYLSPDGYDQITDYQTNHSTYFSGNVDADPLFTDAPGADYTVASGSTMINGATWLTQVNDTEGGSGTLLVVDDARYFYTTGSPWNTPGTTMQNDTIYVDNPSSADFTTTITEINYGTNTLTLAASKNWQDDASVYHCPDGVCFSGVAPDIGAYEVVSAENPSVEGLTID